MEPERSRAPRYPFIADVEVTEIASETRLRARTSDLSIGGCFLDMMNPTPQGTKMQIKISHANETFLAKGYVVFVAPNMGMGVAFTDIEENYRAILDRWLAECAR